MVRTLRSLLRRMKYAAPGIRTVAWHGEDTGAFVAAAAAEELVPLPIEEELDSRSERARPPAALCEALRAGSARSTPDAEVYYLPDREFAATAQSRARVVAVVARRLSGGGLPPLLRKRPARHYLTLREWVGGWFPGGSVLGRLAARALVSPAVGARLSAVKWPGNSEWIFAREPGRGTGDESPLKFLLVTFCGAGVFPIMPATLASALMLPLAFAVRGIFGPDVFFALSVLTAALATLASVWLEKWAAQRFLAEDPREFVLDEVAGMAVAWALLPAGAAWWAIVAGFLAFRVFDIFKWGVDWVERLPVRGKIVWDDLLAGLYAGIAVWLFCLLIR